MATEGQHRAAIQDLIAYYAFLCDTGQTHRVAKEIFTPDATIDYGSGRRTGRDAIHAFFTGSGGRIIATSHHVSNILVRLDGDEAHCHSRVIAWHWEGHDRAEMKNLPQAETMFVGGYQDRLIPVAGHWRIHDRRSVQLALGIGEVEGFRSILSGAADRQPDFAFDT